MRRLFFKVLLHTNNYVGGSLPGTSLPSLEPRFRLSSGCSVTAFDRLRGTRVVALPRTRSPKKTVLPAVVATSIPALRQLAVDLAPSLLSA